MRTRCVIDSKYMESRHASLQIDNNERQPTDSIDKSSNTRSNSIPLSSTQNETNDTATNVESTPKHELSEKDHQHWIKRNQEFHSIFKSISEEESYLDMFSCALQRDILLQGRLYMSNRHLCFNSNIFGYVTNLIIAFEDIISMEKKSAALIFPNSILISTLHAKHFFASFMNRDLVFQKITRIWKNVLRATSIYDIPNATQKSSESIASVLSAPSRKDAEEIITLQQALSEVSSHSKDAKNLGTEKSSSITDFVSVFHDDYLDTFRADTEKLGIVDAMSEHFDTIAMESPTSESSPGPVDEQRYKCGCHEHGSITLLDRTIFMTLTYLHSILFDSRSSNSQSEFLVSRGASELSIGSWVEQPLATPGNLLTKTKCRIVSFKLPHPYWTWRLSSFRVSIIEKYVKSSNKSVSIIGNAYFPDLPASQHFDVQTKYCLLSVDYLTSHLLVTANIKVKNIGSSWMARNMVLFVKHFLQQYFSALDAFLVDSARSIEPSSILDERYRPQELRQHTSRYKKSGNLNEQKTLDGEYRDDEASVNIEEKHWISDYLSRLRSPIAIVLILCWIDIVLIYLLLYRSKSSDQYSHGRIGHHGIDEYSINLPHLFIPSLNDTENEWMDRYNQYIHIYNKYLKRNMDLFLEYSDKLSEEIGSYKIQVERVSHHLDALKRKEIKINIE